VKLQVSRCLHCDAIIFNHEDDHEVWSTSQVWADEVYCYYDDGNNRHEPKVSFK
jgi:hypothetical protein